MPHSSGLLGIANQLKAERVFSQPSYYFPFFKNITMAKVTF
jgi:hypothetical protein